jgi:transposase, IS30 family
MSNLTLYEREQIEYYLKCKLKLRKIARLIHRDHSVVVREIKRHKPQFSKYSAKLAQCAAERKSHFTNKRKLDKDWHLKRYVLCKLKLGWSPEQITGRLIKYSPRELKDKHLCMETIYQYIYNQDDGEGAWYQYLRRAKHKRQKRYSRISRLPAITGKVSIHERPDVINGKRRYGDWETDLLCFGRSKGAVSVQYERKAQYANITKILNKKADTNYEVLVSLKERFPADFTKSITFDNGSENANHLQLKYDHNVKTYFCDAYASWQKGGVENLNGLLRQYLPKKTNPNTISDEYIRNIQELLNARPRKKLGYKTPAEIIKNHIEKLKMVH